MASFGGEASDVYPPMGMVGALMQHRVVDEEQQAAHAGPRGVRAAAKHGGKGRAGTSPPPFSSPPPATTPLTLPNNPDHAQYGRRRGLPGGDRGTGMNDLSVGALANGLQDAVLVGLGVLPEGVIPPGSTAVVIRPACQWRAVFFFKSNSAFVVWAAIVA